MTRLFVRFYVGVLAVLIVAWCIQAFVFRQQIIDPHRVEAALGGGTRLARESLAAEPITNRDNALKQLQTKFDYPLQIVASQHLSARVLERFSNGDDVAMYLQNGLFVVTPLSSEKEVLQLGPIPLPRGPTETDILIGLGAVLLLVALAIAFLLRPLARQLSLFERTAVAIAGGNFSARVDERRAISAKTLARAFNDMAERTETLLRTQRELLQAVSHELRTPLSRINFAIDLIRTANDEQQREPRLRSLETAAQELDDLVGELLRYVRLETNTPQLEMEHIELLPFVELLIDKHAAVHESKQFEIGPELSGGKIHLLAHRSSLERALGNLCANAGRFARHKVVIDAHVSLTATAVDVDDDGPGIPEADRTRVFDPFVRLADSGHGAGLGLALVKRIVANHGGTVAAQENPLGGCRIRTIWPS